jgi:hypothetical protein
MLKIFKRNIRLPLQGDALNSHCFKSHNGTKTYSTSPDKDKRYSKKYEIKVKEFVKKYLETEVPDKKLENEVKNLKNTITSQVFMSSQMESFFNSRATLIQPTSVTLMVQNKRKRKKTSVTTDLNFLNVKTA